MTPEPRILIVDDNVAIHDDFRKILTHHSTAAQPHLELEKALFGNDDDATPSKAGTSFRCSHAHQGQEALELVRKAIEDNDPYSLVFMDVRMPPGWDGIETVRRIRPVAPDIQVVICTAFSDYSWEEITRQIGQSDNLLILKKPFETIEVVQLAHALTRKWELNRQAYLKLSDLDRMVQERTSELLVANGKLREEIKERARMQEAMRHSEERFAAAFRSSPMAMAILDQPENNFLDANQSFVELAGYDLDRLLKHSAGQLRLWSDHVNQRLVEIVPGSHLHNHACILSRCNGENCEIVLWVESISLNSGPCLLLIAEDITDQLKLQMQLRQSQKMEAVGRLAAGIAHEFNNMLTVIQGHAEMICLASGNQKLVAESGARISQCSLRAAALTRQLLAFSRKTALDLKPVNLSKAVEATRSMLTQILGERHELQFKCDENLPLTLLDAASVEQVLINLVINARDAMQGGTICISTGRIEFTETDAKRIADARVGAYVYFKVSDTGCGMDDVTITRVFDPFFTTKDVGKGTGLGLSVIHGIVRQHSGCIEITSQIGVGSNFMIYLPVFEGEQTAGTRLDPGKLESVPRGHGETVLVVEDEKSVRDMAVLTLERAGYKVMEAPSAPAAIKLWDSSTTAISVLVTDLVLPHGMTGNKLAQVLQDRNAGLRTIFISGYSVESIKEELPPVLLPGVNFLAKPFAPQTLVKAVNLSLHSEN